MVCAAMVCATMAAADLGLLRSFGHSLFDLDLDLLVKVLIVLQSNLRTVAALSKLVP